MSNYENKDFSRLEIGKKYNFPCITLSNGKHFISSIVGDPPMGTSSEVSANGEGEREVFIPHEYGILWHEIRIGDLIIEYDRYEENKLHANFYRICEFNNNVVVVLAIDEEMFYRDQEEE